MDDFQTFAVACGATLIAVYFVRWYTDPVSALLACIYRHTLFPFEFAEPHDHEPQLRAIPTVGGPSLPGLSYLAAWNTMRNCRAILDEGYREARLSCLL